MRHEAGDATGPTPASDGVGRSKRLPDLLGHARRYSPLYATAVSLVVLVAAFPTQSPRLGTGLVDSPGAVPRISAQTASPDAAARTAKTQARTGRPDVAQTVGPRATSASAAKPIAPTIAGTARGGFPCRTGVRMIPFSSYAPQCVAKHSGNNGGSTYRGVTAKTIKIAVRKMADEQTPGGGPLSILTGPVVGDPNDWEEARNAFTPYFNKMIELYGREVVFENFQGRGNSVEELNQRGHELACADATAIAKEVGAFGVEYWGAAGTSGPFAECAVRHGLFLPHGGVYYPESYYKRWHPYVMGIHTECEGVMRESAEYVGKKLTGRNAKFAGDAVTKKRQRVFGVMVPENDAYLHCGKLFEQLGRSRWNYSIKHRYEYSLDPPTLSNQAAEAIVQFKAEGVTSIVLIADFATVALMTRHAASQNYHPEWVLVGLAGQDLEPAARLYDQDVVDGHMFGLSQASGPVLYDPKGEAWKVWNIVRPGKPAPPAMEIVYHFTLDIFNKLSAAGPNLTPANIAAGMRAYRGGSPLGALGRWEFARDHTGLDDSREVIWDADGKAYDGKRGVFRQNYGGRRFDEGEIPSGEPNFEGAR